MKTVPFCALALLVSTFAAACGPKRAPSSPPAPSASPLEACCKKLDELWRQADIQQTADVVRSPAEQTALQDQVRLARAAGEVCQAEVDAKGPDAAASFAKVKASAGALALPKLAPDCAP